MVSKRNQQLDQATQLLQIARALKDLGRGGASNDCIERAMSLVRASTDV